MSEEPDALIAHVRISGGRGSNSLVYPTKGKIDGVERHETLERNGSDRPA